MLARDFDETKVERIEIGKTTKSEIISIFGDTPDIATSDTKKC